MENNKKVNPADLPQPQTDLTATQQGEEFIDKSNSQKDKGDIRGRAPGDSENDNELPQQANHDRSGKK
ncbi:MAG TPA: hypothetical protein VK628_10305 [Flavitalea sp.]|nr:hypothetical protein [Flavitalea sp.]